MLALFRAARRADDRIIYSPRCHGSARLIHFQFDSIWIFMKL